MGSGVLPVFALFLVSGATGLAYEVIWTRMLVRIFGASSFAVSTVLAAYMAGFALGSYLFGRVIDRKGNPVLIYGLLELGIGAFALAMPALLAGLNPLYRGLYGSLEGKLYALSLVRFLLSFTLLLIPTTLMGGTLPVLSRFVTRSLSNLAFRVGWLYSINTFGAVAGTFITGFLLLPHLGMRTTTLVAASCNLAIFAVAMALSKRGRRPAKAAATAAPSGDPRPAAGTAPTPAPAASSRLAPSGAPASGGAERLVLAAFFMTGLAALSAEVIWTRVLALVVGTTVYAFSTMLTVFLFGLALGSAIFARLAQRTRRPATALGALVVAIGATVFASTAGFNHLPMLYMRLYQAVAKTWQTGVAIEFLLSAVIMIVPAVLMGGTFPLVARIYATDLGRVGRRIGIAYAFNTLGSILGSFVGSFVLLEVLGVEKGMMVVMVIYLAVGAALLAGASEGLGRRVRSVAAVAVAVGAISAVAFGPRWDKQIMTSGVYIYAGQFETPEGLTEAEKLKELLFYDEGPGATVAVERNQFILSLKIDGKVDASTGADMILQEMLSHIPLLLHPKPDTVLVIGLGCGMSLGSAGRHPVKHLDCVELLENVVEAQRFYADTTYHCLEDPRVRLILGDGRNHVLLSARKYDVIISEPTNCWISGVGDLFTLEFFTLARERLKPGGIMAAWFQTYHMGDADLRSGVKTFMSVFPYTSLWLANESDLVMVGSLEPHQVDEGFIARMDRPEVAADLARVGIRRHSDLLSAQVMDRADLEAYVGDARIHTDDNMLMEFHTGRRIYETTQIIHLAAIVPRYWPTRFDRLDEATNAETSRQVEAKRLAFQGTILTSRNQMAEALAIYSKAYELAPGDPYVVDKYVEAYCRLGDALLMQGRYDQAADTYRRVVAASTNVNTWTAYDGLGVVYIAKGLFAEARDAFGAGLRLNPYNSTALLRYGDALMELGDSTRALEAFAEAYKQGAWNLEAGNKVAWCYAERGQDLDRALRIARDVTRASEETPDETTYLDTLGWVYYKLEDYREAARALERALKADSKNYEAVFHLAIVREADGDAPGAERLLKQVVEMNRDGDYGRQAAALLNK